MASIKPHGQGWKVQVSVRDPQTGKYRVVSKQVNGNKREAQRVARDMETAKETGRLKPGQSPTLADYAGLWLEGRKHQLAHNTYRGYLTNIKNHINPYLGSVKIRDLSVAAVRAWISRLRDAGYAPRTIQYARVNLNMVMAAALDEGLIATNPVSKVGSPKLERRKMEILDEVQVRRLVEGAAKTRLIAPIVFVSCAGCGVAKSAA